MLPLDAAAHFELATTRIEQDRLEEGVRHCDQAIALSLESLNGEAVIALLHEALNKAVAYFNKTVQIACLVSLGKLFQRRNELAMAMLYLSDSIAEMHQHEVTHLADGITVTQLQTIVDKLRQQTAAQRTAIQTSFTRLAEASTLNERQQIIKAQPDLMTPLADYTIQELIAVAPDPETQEYQIQLLFLLRNCDQLGIDETFSEIRMEEQFTSEFSSPTEAQTVYENIENTTIQFLTMGDNGEAVQLIERERELFEKPIANLLINRAVRRMTVDAVHPLLREKATARLQYWGAWKAGAAPSMAVPSKAEASLQYIIDMRTAQAAQEILYDIDTRYGEGGDTGLEALAMFDLDREQIEKGHQLILGIIEQDFEAAELGYAYPISGHQILEMRLEGREYLRWWMMAFQIARSIQHLQFQNVALVMLARVYARMGEVINALHCCEISIMLSQELGDTTTERQILSNAAAIYAQMGKTETANAYRQRASELRQSEKLSLEEQVEDFATQGNLQLRTQNYQAAYQSFEQALAIVHKMNNKPHEALLLCQLGTAKIYLKDYDAGLGHLNSGLQLAQQLKDHATETRALGNIGTIYLQQKNFPKALDYFEQALKIAQQYNLRLTEGQQLGNIGSVHLQQSCFNDAIKFLEQSANILEQLVAELDLLDVRKMLQQAYIATNQHQAVEEESRKIAVLERNRRDSIG